MVAVSRVPLARRRIAPRRLAWLIASVPTARVMAMARVRGDTCNEARRRE
ncbi:hypothetical protein HMPREF9006_0906 [Actinomyces sp. oral taxon 180 str. F0310]|nr:hypothetical protein HMPREF9006_0906 [Actinomyces sp. oral taxon 180 str. F0310]